MTINAKDIKIGDVIRWSNESPACQMTVTNVRGKEITVFRPYVSLSDFTTTAGAIPYIGIETFSFTINDNFTYELLGNIYHERK